jgi:predicted PolB exonuclease-like 3'-5' exonuclease
MFTRAQIEKFLFFDIETAGGASSFMQLSERMQGLWEHRAEFLRNQLSIKYPDNADKEAEQLFLEKAALQAEFGRVVCVSFGKVKFTDAGEPVVQIVSYTDQDEKALLTQTFKVMNGMAKNNVKLFGHNIKRFDIPFLCKRAFINKIEPAIPLQIWDKKPWEIAATDTSELWSFGAWQEGFTSLDLLCAVLDIQSPKDAMKGDEVHYNFYDGNIEGIKTYCQKDVISLIRVAFSLASLNQFEESDIIFK